MATTSILTKKSFKDPSKLNVYIILKHGSGSNSKTTKSLNICVQSDMWDFKINRPKVNHPDYLSIRRDIDYAETLWMDVFKKLSVTTNEATFVAMKKEWENKFVIRKIVDNSRSSIVVEFVDYLNRMLAVDMNRSKSFISINKELQNKIQIFCEEKNYVYTVEEFSSESNIISFGNWIKRNPTISSSSKLKDGTVRKYLETLMSFFRYLLNADKNRNIRIYTGGFFVNQWNETSEMTILSEDMYQAIIDTNIDVSEDLSNLEEKAYLDTLKLMLNHGFRYSDLFSLTHENIIDKIINGKRITLFKYIPPKPKRKKKSIEIMMAPGTKDILNFWKDKNISNYVADCHFPKGLKETSLGKHIIKKEEAATIQWFNNDPIVKMPQPTIEMSKSEKLFNKSTLRDRVYYKIQVTWLKQKYDYDWKKYLYKPIGFMKEVLTDYRGNIKTHYFYETLAFHYCRHTFISRALNTLGMSLPHVQYLAGHASATTTAKYVHTVEDECHASLLEAYENQIDSNDYNRTLRKVN